VQPADNIRHDFVYNRDLSQESAMPEMKSILFTRGVPAAESFPVDDLMDSAMAALRRHGPTILQ
jgi:hypothetical protein